MSDKKKPVKAKTKPYTLKIPVSIDGKIHPKGSKVELTKEGADAFRFKNRI